MFVCVFFGVVVMGNLKFMTKIRVLFKGIVMYPLS